MRVHTLALTPLVCLVAAACTGHGSAAVNGKTSDTPTDCVEVVGGADCSSTGTATGGTGGTGGTATGGTGTGTGGQGTGSTGGIDTWVGSNDPGTGAGDLYLIEARVDADRDSEDIPFWYQTDMRVEIWDDQGNRFSGLDVHLDTQSTGDTVLQETNTGRYEATVDTYARTYTLRINPNDPSTSFTAEAVGPANHVFQAWPPEPWDVSGPDIPIQWAPAGATYASIDTRGTGTIDIDDSGSYMLQADRLDQEAGEVGEERVRLHRWEVLDLTNALPNSWFRVGVRIERDPVDTTDTRFGQLSGDITLNSDYASETGDVFVLAWTDAQDPPNDPPAAWSKIPDPTFVDFGSYLVNMLEPGDWYVLVYLDADHSDAGLPAPDGPTDGDPFDDTDVQIDPNGTHVRNFDLNQRWNGW